jgi:phosphoserine phosphatase RsbU/P
MMNSEAGMKSSRPSAGQDWKKFLSLGEELFHQPNALAQCQLIAAKLRELTGCEAQVWLAEPYYPLPGEANIDTLPGAPVNELVRRAFDTRQPFCQGEAEDQPLPCPPGEPAIRIAYPIVSQEVVLGVIQAERAPGRPFRPKDISFIEAFAAHAGAAMQTSRQSVLKNWRLEQMALVRSVSTQVANVHDINQLCQRVTRLILDSFHYYHVSIFTIEPGHDELLFRASATQTGAEVTPPVYTVHLGEGMIGTAAQSGAEQIAQDVGANPYFRPLKGLDATRAEAALPLAADGRILGVLDVESDRRAAFHEYDVLVLRALADAIALAVEGARLYTAQKHRADQLSAVFEVTHVLSSILDLDRLLEEVVRAIQRQFGYQYVHIFSVHPGRRKLFYLSGSGGRSERMRLLDIAYDLDDPTGVIPHAARTAKTYLANDVSQDEIYRPSELPPDDTRSELAIPLAFGDEVLGVLDLQSDQSNAFAREDVSLLESLAASIAIAYHNATLYRSEQWRRQVGDSFRDVASLLSTNVGLDRLLDTILTELERNLPCDAAAVWLVEGSGEADGSSGDLRLAAVHGITPDVIEQARTANGALANWLNSALEQTDSYTRQESDPMGPLGLALGLPGDYSSIVAPLRTGDQPLGVLTLVHHTANRYGSEARSIIATFAGYAAVAIQNARLYNEAQTQAWLSTILLQVAEASQSVNSIDELLSSMVRLTRLLVGIKRCAMFLWDEVQDAFVLNAWYGLERRPQQTVFREEDAPALARLRSQRGLIYIQDPAAELSLPSAALPDGGGTLVLLPLLGRDTLLGAYLVTHQSAFLDQQTQSILQGIAHQTTVALENMHLLESRQEEAYVTAVLLQVAQAVVSQNELPDILDTIVHLMPILVGIDAAVVCLWDPGKQSFYTAQAYAGSHELEDDLFACTYAAGEFKLIEQVGKADGIYYCKIPPELTAPCDWYGLDPLPIEFMQADSLAPGEDWLLAFPLAVKGELLGVLLAKESQTSYSFQQRRLEIVTGIAQQISLAIQNERLKQEMVAQERLESEVQLARQIQQTFLPSRLPKWAGWEIAARWRTARQMGGDFYDIFKLSRDRLGLAIADVSDKGLPAALYMTVARTLVRAYAQAARSPAAVLSRANHPLVADSPYAMFVTAAYAILSPETGELIYANAGHNRPMVMRAVSREIEQLPKGGMALGVLSRIPLQDYPVKLEHGDCLVMYTDGVTESFSPTGEAYGEEHLRATLLACFDLPVEETVNRIEASLVEFRAGAPASDDTTLLAIRRL